MLTEHYFFLSRLKISGRNWRRAKLADIGTHASVFRVV